MALAQSILQRGKSTNTITQSTVVSALVDLEADFLRFNSNVKSNYEG
jgi:hypothetical protein